MFITPSTKSNLKELTDDSLVYQFQQNGDQMYITELYARYVHLVFGACLKYLKNKEESRDMVMHLFEKIIKTLPSKKIDSFKVWLYVLIKNECYNYLRNRKAKVRLDEDWGRQLPRRDLFLEKEQLVFAQRKEQEEQEAMAEKTVKQAIKKMKEERRLCLRLFFFEGKSYKQIAAKLGLDTGQVKTHLQSGKRQLRQILSTQQSSSL